MVCLCLLVEERSRVRRSKPVAGMCSRCRRSATVADMKTVTRFCCIPVYSKSWKAIICTCCGKKKLNCDVAVRVGGKIGYGFTLRDEYGRILLAGKKEAEAMRSSTLLEGMKMRYAMRMVRQYGEKTDSVESDSRKLVDGIKSKGALEVYCDMIIEDIKALA